MEAYATLQLIIKQIGLINNSPILFKAAKKSMSMLPMKKNMLNAINNNSLE